MKNLNKQIFTVLLENLHSRIRYKKQRRQDEEISTLMKNIPGVPGRDYPIISQSSMSSVVKSSDFTCEERVFGGMSVIM